MAFDAFDERLYTEKLTEDANGKWFTGDPERGQDDIFISKEEQAWEDSQQPPSKEETQAHNDSEQAKMDEYDAWEEEDSKEPTMRFAPCRSCKNWKEKSFQLHKDYPGGFVDGYCRKGIRPLSFDETGAASQQDGEQICSKYNHDEFVW